MPVHEDMIKPSMSRARSRFIKIVGCVYVAIGAAVFAGIMRMVVPPGPQPDSREAQGLEWAPLVIPIFLLMSAVFTFAGYWVMTHPPVFGKRTILLIFVAATSLFLVWGEYRRP
jgi:hypothetical protein